MPKDFLSIVRHHPVAFFLAIGLAGLLTVLIFLENRGQGSAAFLEAHFESRGNNYSRLVLLGGTEEREEVESVVRAVSGGFSGRPVFPLPAGRWESLQFYFSLSPSTGEIGEIQVIDRAGEVLRELPLIEWEQVGTIADFTVVGNRAAYWVQEPLTLFALQMDLSEQPLVIGEFRYSLTAHLITPLLVGVLAGVITFWGLAFLLPALLAAGGRMFRWLGARTSRLPPVYRGWFVGALAASLLFFIFIIPALRNAWADNAVPLTFSAEIRSDTIGTLQVYYDIGRGLREEHSGKAYFIGNDTWERIEIELPRRRIHVLRLDPRDDPGRLMVRNLRLLRPNGSEAFRFALEEVTPTNDIAHLEVVAGDDGRVLRIETTPDAVDPNLLVGGGFPIREKAGIWLQWNRVVISAVILLPLTFMIGSGLLQFREKEAKRRFPARFWRYLAARGWRIFRHNRWLARGKVADIYAVLALGFGLIFCFLTPPFQSPDEYSWFNRAWMISEGQLFPVVEDGVAGGYVPESFFHVNHRVGYNIPFHPQIKTSREKIRFADELPLDAQNVNFERMGDSTHSLFPYIPQAVGIAIARALDFSPLKIFYAGRLTNLLAGVFLIWLGLRLLPAQRLSLAVAALSPMMVFLFGSNSHDVWTLALIFFLVCYLVRLKTLLVSITGRDIAVLMIVFLLIITSKFVYLALFPLLLLIPGERFGSERKRWVTLLGMGGCLGAAFILWMAALSFYPPFNYDQENVEASFQVEKLIQEPFYFFSVLIETFREMRSLWTKQAIALMGWVDADPGNGVRWLFISALIGGLLADATAKVRHTLSPLERSLVYGVVLGVMCLIITLFFIIWTVPFLHFSYGVQGRYFIPLIPVLLLGLSFALRPNLLYTTVLRILVMGIVLTYLSLSAVTLLNRYWE